MIRTGLFFALGAVAVALLTGCACLCAGDLRDEEQVLQLLRDYEMAMATYNAEAAMDLLSDDYEGWRGTGKEGITRFVEMMAEGESTYEVDLTEAVVTVEGDTARASDVVTLMGQWESSATWVLTRTDGGWKILTIEFQR